jgi:hypothetical protein
MRVEFLEQFEKDLDKISDPAILKSLAKLIGIVENSKSLLEVVGG